MINKAREWGYTDLPNPCQGVKGFRESGRDRYVSDAEFQAVWEKADQTLRDAMDLALLTGQRIELTGELAKLIERINARPRERLSAFLVQDDNGRPLGTFGLRSRFDKARSRAGVNFQFRDIRAKTASDTGDLAHSQQLLGHKKRDMTEHYVRERVGQRVKPLR